LQNLEKYYIMRIKKFWFKYKKPFIITISVVVLQIWFGFDPKFTVINLIWLLV